MIVEIIESNKHLITILRLLRRQERATLKIVGRSINTARFPSPLRDVLNRSLECPVRRSYRQTYRYLGPVDQQDRVNAAVNR